MIDQTSTTDTPFEAERYSFVAIILHWAIAVLILANLLVGFFMSGLELPFRRIVVTAHISFGITVLALTVVRILWRVAHRPPRLDRSLSPWERQIAHVVHVSLYVLMLAGPVTGWSIVSSNPLSHSEGALVQAERRQRAISAGQPPPPARVSDRSRLWWIVALPPIRPLAELGSRPAGLDAQHRWHERFMTAHTASALLMIGLLLLHVAGALKHQFVDRRPELMRMGFGRAGNIRRNIFWQTSRETLYIDHVDRRKDERSQYGEGS